MSTTTGHGSKVSAWKILYVMAKDFVVHSLIFGLIIGAFCAVFYGAFLLVRYFAGTDDDAILTLFVMCIIGAGLSLIWEAIGGLRNWWRQTREDLERQNG